MLSLAAPAYTLSRRCSWALTNWTRAPSWTCSADPLPRVCSPDSTTRRTWPGPSSPAQVRQPGSWALGARPPYRPGGGRAEAFSPFPSGCSGGVLVSPAVAGGSSSFSPCGDFPRQPEPRMDSGQDALLSGASFPLSLPGRVWLFSQNPCARPPAAAPQPRGVRVPGTTPGWQCSQDSAQVTLQPWLYALQPRPGRGGGWKWAGVSRALPQGPQDALHSPERSHDNT